MKIKLKIFIIFLLAINLVACSGSKKKKQSTQKTSKTMIKNESNNSSLFNDDTKPFYTVDPKLEEIESEIALLKHSSKVLQGNISASG